MSKPILLDLFCGAGGCSVGYRNAGFEVVGVDKYPQPNYPFKFIQSDALEFLEKEGLNFDIIHASPPCQGYSTTRYFTKKTDHDLFIPIIRELLMNTNKPYVIENVEGAKNDLLDPIMLCGTMFDLKVIRHRLFEISQSIEINLKCNHVYKTAKRGEYDSGQRGYITVAGNNFQYSFAKKAMGIEWMKKKELAQAIPPIYTEWIGKKLMEKI